jgi:glycosyltransferase involved in cell wall biosynthesis
VPHHPNVTVHGLRHHTSWLSPLVAQQTGRPLIDRAPLKAILTKPVDVVHFHNISLFGPAVMYLGGAAQPAVKLYTTHEYWLVCPTHVLWKFGRRICDRPTCATCTIAAGRPPQLWRHTRLLPKASAHIDRFLSPSAFTIRLHADRGFEGSMTHLRPFTPTSDDDWRSPGPRPHPRPYFLYIGRLEAIKGLETLLRIWRDRRDVDLVVVGDGSLRHRVEAAAANNPHIVARGFVQPASVGAFYVHSIACIVPSIIYEIAPTVVLEAFARKTPVIARDLGGVAELVREGNGGLLYETDDELRAAIDRLRCDASLQRELGERGYASFLTKWTTDVHMANYLTLIDDIASQKYGHLPWRLPS